MNARQYVVVVDKPTEIIKPQPDMVVVSAGDYIANKMPANLRHNPRIKVINLCGDYDYLSKGYYCSLLAEARNCRCVPATQDIINLNWKRLYQASLPELDALLEKTFRQGLEDQVAQTHLVYFGRTEKEELQPLARRVFDIFRVPIIAVQIKYTTKWTVSNIEAWSLDEIPPSKHVAFNEALTRFTGAAWSRRFVPAKERYWMAVLHDPQEKLPPSDKGALKKFIAAARRHNCAAELITKYDLPTLLEYDALFLRETTSINHHTFRFAHKAEQEGIPVIDDTASIIRCCNKVFLNEILSAHRVPVPKTIVLEKRRSKDEPVEFTYPFILKIPDGSFSRGVYKVNTPEEFSQHAKCLFSKSDIILAQEFMPSEYDWRIGVLGGEPLFASKYFMAKGHWQIYQHGEGGKVKGGGFATVPIREVPEEVLKCAIKATKLIGNGLYGVDLKLTERGVYVIEINDNPNIDSGVEDHDLGDELYDRLIRHFISMIEK